ncbi:MAG: 30S ribosomal protein S15 [Candidatus Omnitrophica bacterium]|nr:30S ribosomal protein S15 [Candidatus Omnitrophota bacterium]
MATVKTQKEKIINNFQSHAKDTGSASVQIALLSTRIDGLTDHLKVHTKDFSSRVGLLQLVSKRRRLLNYLKREDLKTYKDVLEKLNLRK